MSRTRKNINIEIGERLRVARENLALSRSEMAESMGLSDEQYKRLESGASSITVDKLFLLDEKYHIDISYLISGKNKGEFDLERYISTCSTGQKNRFLATVLMYLQKQFIND